jgi:opacity protein-like surface antigen
MSWKPAVWMIVMAGTGLAWPSAAAAQSFGIGPRMSFIRGDLVSGTPSERMFGGTVRLATSRHIVFEGAMDFKSQVSTDARTTIHETPLQGSLLLFPVRAAFSPYLLAGYGLYRQTADTVDAAGNPLLDVTLRRSGWHVGLGAELSVARHASIYADYRYRFVHFGSPQPDEDAIHIPGSSVIPALGAVHLSHSGSMWTSGVAFYF